VAKVMQRPMGPASIPVGLNAQFGIRSHGIFS
jgi:hypothetical protein